MQTVKFVTMDNEKVCVWYTTNELKAFRNFMQYILDSCDNPENFMLWDLKSDRVHNMYQIATKQYGMRKRTLDERLNNIQTGKWKNVIL